MKCTVCLTPLDEDALFCPMCGQRVVPEPQDAAQAGDAEDGCLSGETTILRADDSADVDDEFRFLAARLDTMDSEYPAADAAAPSDAEPQPDPYVYIPETEQPVRQQPYGYANGYAYPSAPQQPYGYDNAYPYPQAPYRPDGDDFGDGYTSLPTAEEGKYRKTSAGKRVGSICLCILMALLLLYAVVNLSLRATLTENNIRTAADSEKLLSRNVITDLGETSAVDYLRELIGPKTLAQSGVTDEMLKNVIRSGRISSLTANILNDYAGYLFSDQDPTYLNAAYIAGELERFNEDLSAASGSNVRAFSAKKVTEMINGGELSFLSIDSDGGYFYQHYDVNPRLPATFASLPILLICIAIVLLCMVMLFVINSANLPAGLSFNGIVLIVIGSFTLLTAAGCFILTFIKDIWVLTDLLRTFAMWSGICSLALLAIGVVMAGVAGALRKKAKKAAEGADF